MFFALKPDSAIEAANIYLNSRDAKVMANVVVAGAPSASPVPSTTPEISIAGQKFCEQKISFSYACSATDS